LVKVTSNGVVVLQNWYDANSRRIAKQELVNGQLVKTLYLYDGWDIVAVMNGQGQLLESYTRGVGLAGDIGTIVAVTHHAGSSGPPGTYYVHHNHRGDVIVTRSTGGATVGTYDYSAFGALKSWPASYDVCRFKFSSKERDPSTGFYYYGYRFYAPQWQRWPNRDPLGDEGGAVKITLTIDDNWGRGGYARMVRVLDTPEDTVETLKRIHINLYQYVANAPNRYIDPVGLIFGSSTLQRIQRYGNKFCALGWIGCRLCCGMSTTFGGVGASIEFAAQTAFGIAAGVVAVGGATTGVVAVAAGAIAVGIVIDAHISFIDGLKSMNSDHNKCMQQCEKRRCER